MEKFFYLMALLLVLQGCGDEDGASTINAETANIYTPGPVNVYGGSFSSGGGLNHTSEEGFNSDELEKEDGLELTDRRIQLVYSGETSRDDWAVEDNRRIDADDYHNFYRLIHARNRGFSSSNQLTSDEIARLARQLSSWNENGRTHNRPDRFRDIANAIQNNDENSFEQDLRLIFSSGGAGGRDPWANRARTAEQTSTGRTLTADITGTGRTLTANIPSTGRTSTAEISETGRTQLPPHLTGGSDTGRSRTADVEGTGRTPRPRSTFGSSENSWINIHTTAASDSGSGSTELPPQTSGSTQSVEDSSSERIEHTISINVGGSLGEPDGGFQVDLLNEVRLAEFRQDSQVIQQIGLNSTQRAELNEQAYMDVILTRLRNLGFEGELLNSLTIHFFSFQDASGNRVDLIDEFDNFLRAMKAYEERKIRPGERFISDKEKVELALALVSRLSTVEDVRDRRIQELQINNELYGEPNKADYTANVLHRFGVDLVSLASLPAVEIVETSIAQQTQSGNEGPSPIEGLASNSAEPEPVVVPANNEGLSERRVVGFWEEILGNPDQRAPAEQTVDRTLEQLRQRIVDIRSELERRRQEINGSEEVYREHRRQLGFSRQEYQRTLNWLEELSERGESLTQTQLDYLYFVLRQERELLDDRFYTLSSANEERPYQSDILLNLRRGNHIRLPELPENFSRTIGSNDLGGSEESGHIDLAPTVSAEDRTIQDIRQRITERIGRLAIRGFQIEGRERYVMLDRRALATLRIHYDRTLNWLRDLEADGTPLTPRQLDYLNAIIEAETSLLSPEFANYQYQSRERSYLGQLLGSLMIGKDDELPELPLVFQGREEFLAEASTPEVPNSLDPSSTGNTLGGPGTEDTVLGDLDHVDLVSGDSNPGEPAFETPSPENSVMEDLNDEGLASGGSNSGDPALENPYPENSATENSGDHTDPEDFARFSGDPMDWFVQSAAQSAAAIAEAQAQKLLEFFEKVSPLVDEDGKIVEHPIDRFKLNYEGLKKAGLDHAQATELAAIILAIEFGYEFVDLSLIYLGYPSLIKIEPDKEVNVFERIKELISEGKSYSEIRRLIARDYLEPLQVEFDLELVDFVHGGGLGVNDSSRNGSPASSTFGGSGTPANELR